MPLAGLVGIEGQVARIDFDRGAAIVASVGHPAAPADHGKIEGLTAPKLGKHCCRPLRIVSRNREMESHAHVSRTCSQSGFSYCTCMPLASLAELRSRIGEEIGVSDWLTIDQNRIDEFAEATEDRQFIHVDPDAAARTPFGGTVAHGFLSLSMLSRMAADAMLVPDSIKMAVNYGLDRVRFIAPVRSGKRIRGRFRLDSVEEKAAGQLLMRHTVTVEIEGEEKPALTAEWLGLIFV